MSELYISPEAQAHLDWRERESKKHRIMTIAEYRAWCFRGDAISHPSSSNAFPGGITIVFGKPEDEILGKTRE